jgi:aminoglycoside phosphotransferase (APT) family kinase protein
MRQVGGAAGAQPARSPDPVRLQNQETGVDGMLFYDVQSDPTAPEYRREASAMTIAPEAVKWSIGQRGAAEQTAVRRLHGGTATAVYVLELDGARRAVLKLFTNADLVRQEPDTPHIEAAMLRGMARSVVPVPRLIAADATGAHAGVPAILMDYISGTVELPRHPTRHWLAALAEPLAQVHRHTCADAAYLPTYEPWVDRATLSPPEWTREPAAWSEALARLAEPPPPARRVLLHRDHHPTNVLWSSGRIVALLDWANACMGPPAVDYAHCRSNLAHLWGAAAADAFRDAATDLEPEDLDPWWDIASLAEWLPGPAVYPGWTELGITWLTEDLVAAHLDEYVVSLVS